TNVDPLSATNISISEQELLRKFRTKINKFQCILCPVCNERFLSIVLVNNMCRQCNAKITLLKKFSAENNMDPGKIPYELK
ncbi:5323_t:CDS:1, partial [Racocetra fulgida]